MVNRMSLLRELHETFADSSRGMLGFEGYEGPFTHLKDKQTIAKSHCVRRLLGIRQSLGRKELDNVF